MDRPNHYENMEEDILMNKARPLHYDNNSEIDVIDFCNMYKLDFTEGNIIKYIVRYKLKNGLEDLQKAKDYLNRLIERESNKIEK